MHDWSENLIFLGVKRSMMLLQYFQWKRLTREYKSIMFQNLTKKINYVSIIWKNDVMPSKLVVNAQI